MSDTIIKPKIFIISYKSGDDVISSALAEDGHVLSGHLSSSYGFAKHDMRLSSNWKHEYYSKHYPDGYELVDLVTCTVEELRQNVEYQAALKKNHELKENESE